MLQMQLNFVHEIIKKDSIFSHVARCCNVASWMTVAV